MKVALISHEGGGISSVSFGLAQSLAKNNIDTTILTGPLVHAHESKRVNSHLKIVRLPILDLPPRAFWFQILNLRRLRKLLKDSTVIHGVSPDASFFFTFCKKKLKKPFVATIHGSPRTLQRVFINSPIASWTLGDLGYQIIEFPLHDFTIDRILRGSNHTVVCSFTVLEELKAYRSLDLSKVSVIYNGINFDEIEKIEVSSEDDKDDLSIVFAGRLFWTKGVMLLLEAFRLLKREFSKVQLNIFGKGPLERRIKEFIVNSDLSDSVHCRGFVTRQELLAEVKKSDAVVLPSMSEAQPIFILEAMACKKPLVAFDIPSMREIISDEESGLLAEAFNVNDLYNKIQLLLSDMKLRSRLGQNAFNYVKKEHSWDMQVEKYIQVYENVVMRN